MKKYLLGISLIVGLYSYTRSEPYEITQTEQLGPAQSTWTVSGASLYQSIQAAPLGQRNCLTSFNVSVSSINSFGNLELFLFPYQFSIIDGPVTTGTTIYNVYVSTIGGYIPYVSEVRSRETALCGGYGTQLNIVVQSTTTVLNVNGSYQGYRRSRP